MFIESDVVITPGTGGIGIGTGETPTASVPEPETMMLPVAGLGAIVGLLLARRV